MKARLLRFLPGALLWAALGGSIAVAAAKKEEPKSPPPAPPAKAEPGVLAIVGDRKITEQDLTSSLPPDRQKAFQNASARLEDIERQAVSDVFAEKWVAQEAKAKGISTDDYYKQEVAANRDNFPAEYKVQISQVKQQVYDAKKAALDEVVGKALEEKAAKDKGVTVEALVKSEVEDKIAPVAPADIDQYYTQNQRQFGGQAKEAVSKQIEDAIRNTRMNQKRAEFRSSLRAAASVRTYLEVPRIPVSAGDGPIKGPKDAPIQIVEFSEFQ